MSLSQEQVKQICQIYSLGQPLSNPQSVQGGMLHALWHLKTNVGEYAIKCLDKRNLNLLEHNVLSPQKTQEIAQLMQEKNVPTVIALKQHDQFMLTIDGQDIIVMPWIEGEVLTSNATASQAFLIGKILSKIQQHSSHFQFSIPKWQGHSQNEWEKLLHYRSQISESLEINNLIEWSERANAASKDLNNKLVLSHRDLDQKNVIWKSPNSPVILDWEYAGLINETLDLLIVALNWSDVTTRLDEKKFKAVIDGYYSTGKTVQPLSTDIVSGYIGYCLDWVSYNLRKLEEGTQAPIEIFNSIGAIKTVVNSEQKIISWYETIHSHQQP